MRLPRVASLVVLAILAILAAASPAAAANTDYVVLLNGDRLTCEVKELSRGQLRVKTDDFGTIYIEWDKVVAISTLGQFDVATHDGRRYVGRFDMPPGGGLAVMGGDVLVITLPFLDVVEVAPIRAKFFDRIDGSMDIGASYAKSSGVAQASFDADATYRRPSFETSADFSSTLSQSPDTPDTARYLLQFGYARFRRNGWQVMPFGLFEHNSDLGLQLRSTAALLLGKYLNRSNHGTLLVSGGISAGSERPVDEPRTTNVDAVIGMTSSIYTYDYPKTNVDFSALVFPALKDPGRVRINTNGKIKREVLRDVYVSFTACTTPTTAVRRPRMRARTTSGSRSPSAGRSKCAFRNWT